MKKFIKPVRKKQTPVYCSNVTHIKLCKNHLREVFHKGLSPESQDPDKMVEMLIQAEKENAFSNNNFPEGALAISAFLNLELTRPSMAGWYTTNLASPER